jgi:predicted transcriptional regulator
LFQHSLTLVLQTEMREALDEIAVMQHQDRNQVLQEAINVYLELFRLKKQVATLEDSVMARLAKNPVSVKGLPRLTRENIYEESIG